MRDSIKFILKKTDFNTVSENDLQEYVHLINNRARKRLGWKTPIKIFYDIDVAFRSRI